MPGTLDSQLVNFEIYNRSTRPKLNHTQKIKKFNEKRYQESISNLKKFSPQDIESRKYHKAHKLPSFKESNSLAHDPWESYKAIKRAWNNEKYSENTPLYMLKEALLDERVRRGFYRETEKPKVEVLVE